MVTTISWLIEPCGLFTNIRRRACCSVLLLLFLFHSSSVMLSSNPKHYCVLISLECEGAWLFCVAAVCAVWKHAPNYTVLSDGSFQWT